MFTCIKCSKDFNKFHLYLAHVKHVHSHEPFFRYICGFKGCPLACLSYSALRAHLYRHDELKPEKNVKMSCMTCGFKSYLQSRFISHFQKHDTIVCPINNCKQTYSIYSSFSSHVSRRHPCFRPTDITHDNVTINSLDKSVISSFRTEVSVDDFDPNLQPVDDIHQSENDFKKNVSLFILKMQEKFLLPQTTIAELIAGMSQVQNNAAALLKIKIVNILKENGISNSILQSVCNVPLSNDLNTTFTMLNSVHLKTKYMKTLGLIEPVQYKLGFRQMREATFQYIPLLENLQAFIKNNDVLDFVMNAPQTNQNTVFTDIYDGTIFQNNEIFSQFPNIQLLLYFDEFSVTNPLRGNQSKHKLAVFYYTLGNIPITYRSCIDDIQLALICKSADLKHFGLNAILAPLINDLKILETEGIVVEDVPYKIKGSLAFIVADNLGAHQIGGYSTCFRTTSVRCRFCLASSAEMQSEFKNSFFSRRSKDVHAHQINMINMDPTYSSVYGLQYDSPFNQLSHFHTSLMLPPDPMHDLLEGIVPMEIQLIIEKLISCGYFTIHQLNSKILSFKFGLHDAANKPSALPKNFEVGLKLNASRVWCLLRLLPLLIGNFVPEGEPVWDLLLMLKEIVDLILAPAINTTYISHLADLINDHHTLLKLLFPDIILKPKHHFLVHYPKLIVEFGPLVACWCMRYESKHLYFKNVAHSIKNFINLPSSFAKKHQQLQCYYNYTSSRAIGKKNKVTNPKLLNRNFYSEDISKVLELYSDFYVVTSAQIKGITYKSGMCILTNFIDEEPVFSKILLIISRNEIIHFVCRTYMSSTLFHIGGYKLSNDISIDVLSYDNIIDKYPLSVYMYNNNSVVIPKYLIFNQRD